MALVNGRLDSLCGPSGKLFASTQCNRDGLTADSARASDCPAPLRANNDAVKFACASIIAHLRITAPAVESARQNSRAVRCRR